MSTILNSFLPVFAGLMPIVNPPGSALLFLAMTRRGTRAQRTELARRIALYAFLIMIVSLYVGAFVLKFFGISVPVLRVAGGMVLAFAGWRPAACALIAWLTIGSLVEAVASLAREAGKVSSWDHVMLQ